MYSSTIIITQAADTKIISNMSLVLMFISPFVGLVWCQKLLPVFLTKLWRVPRTVLAITVDLSGGVLPTDAARLAVNARTLPDLPDAGKKIRWGAYDCL